MAKDSDQKKAVRKKLSSSISKVLKNYDLALSQCGVKTYNVPAFNSADGFWADPNGTTNKPPRWLVRISRDADGTVSAELPDGHGAERIAHSNTTNQAVGGLFVRVVPSILMSDGTYYLGDDEWEWILFFCFPKKLEAGSAAQLFDSYDPTTGALQYKNAGQGYVAAGLFTMNDPESSVDIGNGSTVTYEEATDALGEFLKVAPLPAEGAEQQTTPINVYDGLQDAEIQKAADDVRAAFKSVSVSEDETPDFEIPESSELIGVDDSVYRQITNALKSGKRHLMFYGPPGTGKTTLAQDVASNVADNEYTIITASADWTSQDVVGGYQPLGSGKIKFMPGVILENFDRPIVIDELNRCDIDKVLGPLFTVLSGQPATLPYLVDPEDEGSSRYIVLPEQKKDAAENEFAPTEHWRLIATINTVDKASLYQMSFALSRRFAWVFVDVPKDLRQFVIDLSTNSDKFPDPPDPIEAIPLADIWESLNRVRPIGAAPIVDLMRQCISHTPNFDFFKAPDAQLREAYVDGILTCLLPLMDGILSDEANALAEAWGQALGLNENDTDQKLIKSRLDEIAL